MTKNPEQHRQQPEPSEQHFIEKKLVADDTMAHLSNKRTGYIEIHWYEIYCITKCFACCVLCV